MYVRNVVSVVLGTCLLVPGLAQAATPEGTAFTYQGQLKLNGGVLNNTADFQFSLWDDPGTGNPPTGGLQRAMPLSLNAVNVVNGLFTVKLDFFPGASAFNGEARWLQIALRSPSGNGGFTTLSPRQPVMATPYASSLVPGALVKGSGRSVPVLDVMATDDALFNPVGIHAQAGTSSGIPWNAEAAVHGDSLSGIGVAGSSLDNYGVFGTSFGGQGAGVGGTGDTIGVVGASGTGVGVRGVSDQTGAGVEAVNSSGLGPALRISGAIQVPYFIQFDNQTPILIWKSALWNIGGYNNDSTFIDDSMTNNDPTAFLILTHNFFASYPQAANNHPVGVYFDGGRGQWAIFNEDGAPMAEGMAFNVLVIKRAN